MRRSALVFLLFILILLLVAIHSVSTLISLLFEDASADAIRLDELPPVSTSNTTSYKPHAEQLIPKIIHQTYSNATVPDRWLAAQQSCLSLHSPDYEYRLWTDDDAVTFISEHYPWFLDTFISYAYNIQRADAIRYFVLRHYGGVYIDLDDGCARRLDPLLKYQAFVRRTIPTGISNDVMGSVPQHPFFVRVTESLMPAHRGWVLPYITIMASTGPLFLSVVWKKWMGEHLAQQELALEGGTGEWEGRVRVLMPDEYDKHPWSFFRTYKGDSWHGGDARFIFWLGKNWLLVTAVGFLLAAIVGIAAWWMYSRLVGMGRRRAAVAAARSRSGSPDGGLASWAAPIASSQRMPWWRRVVLAAGKGKGAYELVEQHDA